MEDEMDLDALEKLENESRPRTALQAVKQVHALKKPKSKGKL
jgi:hypothetical protein